VDVLRSQQVSCIKSELVTVLATDSQDGHGGVKTHNAQQQNNDVNYDGETDTDYGGKQMHGVGTQIRDSTTTVITTGMLDC